MASNKKIITGILLIIMVLTTFFSCGIYSFSGANITGDSISIDFFQNKSTLVQPTLSQVFTDALRNKFTSQSKLELVTDNADLHLEGEIIDYKVKPIAVQANETAAQSRLTIIVKVRFTNKQKPSDNFEQTFSAYYDFNTSDNFNSIQDELIAAIVKTLVEDIFNKSVVNW